ncbi:MAG: SPOR domain-containing protein [Rhodobacteraceae bacterium]|nr:SPOR domain-containing protein [Paracoccaceae bacterium]
MADADFDEFEDYGRYDAGYARYAQPTVPAGVRLQRLINGAGALTSVALIAGLGYWGYELAMRDVHGIPVIRALEGPARIAPENPGGEVALHQGLAVNRIAADGTAAEAADTLTLAPRATGLSDEDQPMGEFELAAVPPPAAPRDPAAALGSGGTAAMPASLDPALVPVAPVSPQRTVLPLPDGAAEPIEDSAEAAEAAPTVPADAAPIAADVPGVKASPRPVTRPARVAMATAPAATPAPVEAPVATDADPASDPIAEAAAAAVAAALAPPPALDVAPGELAAGARLVQIGAFSSEDEAATQWDQTAERYGSLFDGKRRVIEPATSGGQVFYRLRVAGFEDIDDARRFCAALLADQAECVPATVR